MRRILATCIATGSILTVAAVYVAVAILPEEPTGQGTVEAAFSESEPGFADERTIENQGAALEAAPGSDETQLAAVRAVPTTTIRVEERTFESRFKAFDTLFDQAADAGPVVLKPQVRDTFERVPPLNLPETTPVADVGPVAAYADEPGADTPFPTFETGLAIVTADFLNMRDRPSPDAERVGGFPRSTRLTVVERRGIWVKVREPNGERTGWVHGDYIRLADGAR